MSSVLKRTIKPFLATRYALRKNWNRRSSTLGTSSNPAMQFPCLDKLEKKTAKLRGDGLEATAPGAKTTCSIEDATSASSKNDPVYEMVKSGFQLYKSNKPIFLDYGGVLPNFELAYETWGTLNGDKSNAILIHTGLSASSHAHSSSLNEKSGWWEEFIGPGNPILDSDKWFIICTNVLGGCYGSTGPSSLDPGDGKPYATRFPMLSIQDMVRAQKRLIDHFGITKLKASVGSSMGGMQSLAYGQLFPDSVEKIVSVSACARSHPSSIAMRHAQRQVLMADPNWNRGFYYSSEEHPDKIPPHVGMKLAREIATVTYRSGPEWESRFGTERLDDDSSPVLCPDFLIETYLDHQGEKFSLEYDANSFLYISKTMDLFSLTKSDTERSQKRRLRSESMFKAGIVPSLRLPDEPYKYKKKSRTTTIEESKKDLKDGMAPLLNKEILVIGVKSDSLFPYWQQREIVELLDGPNDRVKHVELDENTSLYGHDTFLLDLGVVGSSIGKFLRNEI
ncbi:unnamed protein product [Kluyveromyces dobzhanskii CBS 2104]|uniref:WGS project CCBQ000000000 data, contig 00058 n=1 Tax=Kluyveromyces dobzhanskii CBS 2104 TaxID=1427455 RepID=A0A0A8LDK8_9SACH|nr:unnamed protein product [Kluyveromyces dobzhanskii CBS 2104]